MAEKMIANGKVFLLRIVQIRHDFLGTRTGQNVAVGTEMEHRNRNRAEECIGLNERPMLIVWLGSQGKCRDPDAL